MIRPQTNIFREAISLDGLWQCRADPKETGEANRWASGLSGAIPIAVPGSWNEQLAETGLLNFTGSVWYQREIVIPSHASERRIVLHFGGADYSAVVYWNGFEVGRSGSPKLPFTVDLTGRATPGQTATLVVKVTAMLPEHGPIQPVSREDYAREGRPKDEYWPTVRFDFFPFGGLNRSVTLNLLPIDAIPAPVIRTGWGDGAGWLKVSGADGLAMTLDGVPVANGRLENVRPWSPEAAQLYTLALTRYKDGLASDQITRRIGFRSLAVEGQRLLLNGEPITLKGFGKHEDTPIAGRGVNLPYLVKDFQLLKWCGANSVRTSHYPYDETFLDLADEMGILIISEVFSVNLDFRRTDARDLAAHKESVSALIDRDGHHACVVAWSLSNEPGYLGEAEYVAQSAPYWAALFAHARAQDGTRPLTLANVEYAGINDPAFTQCDFLSVNRYYGWYTEPGQLSRAEARLRELFDTLAATHAKPVFVSEFGADAVAGMHATTDQVWTEDYQSDFIETYWQVMSEHPACIGGHVWNFADFRTAQHGRRVVMNRKGVFTRERDPKRAAFTLRRLWGGD